MPSRRVDLGYIWGDRESHCIYYHILLNVTHFLFPFSKLLRHGMDSESAASCPLESQEVHAFENGLVPP